MAVAPSASPYAAAGAAAPRDPRLDFFRGVAMFIIYVAHCRGNALYWAIPARYGISDAANMFVFISGMTCSIAFGGTFTRQGWLIGTARIAYRCLQLYAAQIGMFFAVAVVVVIGTHLYPDSDYIAVAQFQHFFADPGDALVGLFTLTYVPHYIDILPLYIVCLAMVPIAMALARISPYLVIAASIALYAATWAFGLNFPANADDQPVWYFDPLAWQLIFFTGFALRRGWVKVSLDSKILLWLSIAILVLGLLISLPFLIDAVKPIAHLERWIYDHSDKTYMDLLQYAHFLASAYVALVILKGREQVLLTPWLKPFVKCGQQALSIFTSGMVLSYIGGMIFDHEGTGFATQVWVNVVAFGLLFAVGYGVAWFKRAPWKRGVAVAMAAADVLLLVALLPSRVQAAPLDQWGYEENSLAFQGSERGYWLRVPPGKPGALPLVIALHGAGETAGAFAGETHLAAAGDAAGMMIAFPSGTGAEGHETFNARLCCGDAVTKNIDDIGFIGAVIDDVAAHHPLDRMRVYATGMSNGGMLVYQLAAIHPEWFAAIAPVAATIGGMTRDGASYLIPSPATPVPVLMIHGMKDGYVLYNGGASPNVRFPNRWKLSVRDALSFWGTADGCAEPPATEELVADKLRETVYAHCAGGSAVKLVAIEDGDHAWPGDIFPAPGGGTRSAAAEILAFFASFTRH